MSISKHIVLTSLLSPNKYAYLARMEYIDKYMYMCVYKSILIYNYLLNLDQVY